MAYFDGHSIVVTKPQPYPEYRGWQIIDCGCCAGIEWGDPGPRECRQCGGGGYLAKHAASGAVALYPGGPFRWREKPAAVLQDSRPQTQDDR